MVLSCVIVLLGRVLCFIRILLGSYWWWKWLVLIDFFKDILKLVIFVMIWNIVVMMVELFGVFRIIYNCLFCFIIVGVMELSICFLGVMVLVFVFISLNWLGMLGLVLKLFILLLRKKLLFCIYILELKLELSVVVMDIVWLFVFIIEVWVVLKFFLSSWKFFVMILLFGVVCVGLKLVICWLR